MVLRTRFSRVMSSMTSMQPVGLSSLSNSGAAVRLTAAMLPSGSAKSVSA